jgi:hypothetical protein
MNINALIDAIVRQTTILIAQLATSAGMRAPLVHTANQVFLDLVRELKHQGLGNKVIADMFGMALRTYHGRVSRLAESTSVGGKSLWAAVLEYLQDEKVARRADVLHRFRHDDDASVRGVLRDLVESGLVYQSGRGEAMVFRIAPPTDRAALDVESADAGTHSLVWVAVSRFGPTTVDEIAVAVPIGVDAVREALAHLVADGRVREIEGEGAPRYDCASCIIPLGATAGWEAAVFDHYQAVVTALCTKLRMGSTASSLTDAVGGSTYGFEVWPGHPLEREVHGLLATVRKMAMDLRRRVESYNEENAMPPNVERVIAYVGQTVLRDETLEEGATK